MPHPDEPNAPAIVGHLNAISRELIQLLTVDQHPVRRFMYRSIWLSVDAVAKMAMPDTNPQEPPL